MRRGAGDAVLRAAGGCSCDADGGPLLYGREAPNFALNRGMVSYGGPVTEGIVRHALKASAHAAKSDAKGE